MERATKSQLPSANFLSSIQKGRPHMNLESQLKLHRHESRGLPLDERAQLSCRLAKEFQEAGEYQAAREALSDFWPDAADSATLYALDEKTAAEIMLRVGA